MPWNPLKHKAVRNGIELYATAPQICADWGRAYAYTLDSAPGLVEELVAEIGARLDASPDQVEMAIARIEDRIGPGRFTRESVQTAAYREFSRYGLC